MEKGSEINVATYDRVVAKKNAIRLVQRTLDQGLPQQFCKI